MKSLKIVSLKYSLLKETDYLVRPPAPLVLGSGQVVHLPLPVVGLLFILRAGANFVTGVLLGQMEGMLPHYSDAGFSWSSADQFGGYGLEGLELG